MNKLLALAVICPVFAMADVIDTAPESVFIYNPSTDKLMKENGSVITSSTVQNMITSPHQFNPGPKDDLLTRYWGIAHIFDKPVASVRMAKADSDDYFLMKVKIYRVTNQLDYSVYYDGSSTFSLDSTYLPGHVFNGANCSSSLTYYSTSGKTSGERSQYTNSGWDENAAGCKSRGVKRRYNGTIKDNTNIISSTKDNNLYYFIKLETPNGSPEPGTYRGVSQLIWRTRLYPGSHTPGYQGNVVNFNYTVIVEPEYHRVEAPSEVKFSKSSDPNHRETSFYADVYGIFSPQMMVTATSANSSGTDFKMNCNECPASYPGILDIQDITYEVDATIEGTSNTFSLQSGVTSTIDLARDSNGFYAGNGVAKVKFDIGYDRSDSTTTVATDLNYEDTLTLVFEPVI